VKTAEHLFVRCRDGNRREKFLREREKKTPDIPFGSGFHIPFQNSLQEKKFKKKFLRCFRYLDTVVSAMLRKFTDGNE
jgi:hypothetical protein